MYDAGANILSVTLLKQEDIAREKTRLLCTVRTEPIIIFAIIYCTAQRETSFLNLLTVTSRQLQMLHWVFLSH